MNLLCVDFIVLFERKTLLDYTNLLSANEYKKNDKIIYNYFKDNFVKSRV